jgi:hypothetical protein
MASLPTAFPPAGMVFEDRVFSVHREDRLDVVVVPGRPVGGDDLLQRMLSRVHGSNPDEVGNGDQDGTDDE